MIQCIHMNKFNDNTLASERAIITFHTSPEVKARLELLAGSTRRSKSFLTNEAVLRYLSEEEDYINDVQAGIKEANAGKLIPHVKAVKYLQALGTGKQLKIPK